MIIRIVIYFLASLFLSNFILYYSRSAILFSFKNIIDMKSRKKISKTYFHLKTWWKDAVVWTRIAKARCETPSMYQSRGKHARHGGNCANRIINTFRPLHYGCNERFLCTFPCADFAPLFARICDRSMHSRAKIRIQRKDSTFTVIFYCHFTHDSLNLRLKRLTTIVGSRVLSVIVKNHLYIYQLIFRKGSTTIVL